MANNSFKPKPLLSSVQPLKNNNNCNNQEFDEWGNIDELLPGCIPGLDRRSVYLPIPGK